MNKKTTFIIRAVLWFFLAVGMPIILIAVKYQIFNHKAESNLSGWTLICIIILFIGINSILNYFLKAFEGSIIYQIISGIKKIILPLVILLLAVTAIAAYIKILQYILTWIIIFEAMAIPINPFPVWAWKRNILRRGITNE